MEIPFRQLVSRGLDAEQALFLLGRYTRPANSVNKIFDIFVDNLDDKT